MAEIVHLNRAPITEAILDFRIKPKREFPLEKLDALRELLREKYPTMERRDWFHSSFRIGPGTEDSRATEARGLHGFFFKSEDGFNIVQFRVDGFTFNRLKPYTAWDEISAEAAGLWNLYIATVDPEIVTRIATRYINHLRLPMPLGDLSKYLTAPPTIPEGFPNRISGFLTRVALIDEETGLMANVTQVLDRIVDPEFAPVIIDVDVYREEQFEPEQTELWTIMNEIRSLKNQIFFKSITDETVRMYE